MKRLPHILYVLLLLIVSSAVQAQETEEDLKEKADKLFEKEQYVEATSLYLRLLSLHPKDVSYNFKYGTCLLFNSDDKKKQALRYLNFAVKSPSVDPRAFYFRGRAFHLNYEFEKAKKMYKKYQSVRSSKDNRYDVDREIQMCDNGKRLLSQFTDIIVSEKKQIPDEKFFRLYRDMQSIGGEILVTERFQSKLDKKRGHVPIVHFGKNAKAVYYSSYGDDGSTGLDIYLRKQLPDGTWGKPFRLPGDVNTPYDDDFPYLHPNGRYLYFSSKGHNSMGGFDVFMARYNPASNGFERVENVDFAICSPDDDLFYVVDSTFQNAYFASARQSEGGKLHVYRVKVARVPIQEVIIMGDFLSEINPENKTMNVRVISGNTGSEVGKIRSNATGKYSHVFPKGGKYTYEIEIEGMDQITSIDFELPFLDEFRPLKQKVIHTTVDGAEVVKIVNLFDEIIEGGAEVIAPILRKKAELDVNIDEFDPEEIEQLEQNAQLEPILAELGFKGMTPYEVGQKLSELKRKEAVQFEQTKNILSGIDQAIIETAGKIEELAGQQQDWIDKANGTDIPEKKHQYLSEAERIQGEIETLSAGLDDLQNLKTQTLATLGTDPAGGLAMSKIEKTFNDLVQADKPEEGLKFLASRKNQIFGVRNSSPELIIRDMLDEQVELTNEQARLEKKNTGNAREIERLETEIQALTSRLPGARKKEKAQLEKEIQEKERELEVYRDELRYNREDIAGITKKVGALDRNVGILQTSIQGGVPTVPGARVDEAVASARNRVKNTPGEDISNQLATLEQDNPGLSNGGMVSPPSTSKQISDNHAAEEQKITNNGDLSREEQLNGLIRNNLNTIGQIDQRVQQIQTDLESDPDNTDLIQEQVTLIEYKNKLEGNLGEWNNELKDLTATPEVALTKEGVIQNLNPGYTTSVDNINGNPDLSPLDRLNQLQGKDQELLTNIETREGQIRGELESDPTRGDLAAELEILTEIKGEVETRMNNRSNEIAGLGTPTPTLTQGDLITQLTPNYAGDKSTIEGNPNLTDKEKWEQLRTNEENLLGTATTELTSVDQQLETNPTDPALLKRKELLTEIVQGANDNIDRYTEQIEAPVASVNTQSTEEIINELIPNYQTDTESIDNNGDLPEIEKLNQLQNLDKGLIENAQTALNTVDGQLETNPADPNLLDKKQKLEEIIQTTTAQTDERAQTINALTNVSSIADIEQVEQQIFTEVNPTYETDREEILSSGVNPVDQEIRLLELDQKTLEDLTKKKEEIDQRLANTPGDAQTQAEATAIGNLVTQQTGVVNGQRNAALAALIGTEKYNEVVDGADRRYRVEIGELMSQTPVDKDAVVAREKELQENIEEEIQKREKSLQRKYSVSVDLELMMLKNELEESKKREESAGEIGTTVVATDQKTYLESIQSNIPGQPGVMLDQDFGTKTELEDQDSVLEEYEQRLTEEIVRTGEELGDNVGNQQLEQQLQWLEEERERVQEKRRRIRVTIGELETSVIASTTSVDSDPEIIRLETKRSEVENQLNNPDLSSFERKELEGQLEEIDEAAAQREGEILTDRIETEQRETDKLDQQLSNVGAAGGNQENITTAKTAGNTQSEVTEDYKEQAEDADSPQEKAYLLQQSEERQRSVNNTLEEVANNESLRVIEQREGVTLLTVEELQKRQRRYRISIGELETQIERVEGEIGSSKKSDLPVLNRRKEGLEKQKEVLENQLKFVENELSNRTEAAAPPVVENEAMEVEMTFNEERKVAGTDAYLAYRELAMDALEIENQIRTLEGDLESERQLVLNMISSGVSPDDEEIKLKTTRIKELEEEVDRMKGELIAQRTLANAELPSDREEAMKIQNLLARGVRPIKTTAIATALIQMPTTGLAINPSAERTESAYSEANPIPVGVEAPSGLVYRVQIGAFARAIPQDLFKEFNPVSGEKIPNSNITRYMAGYFNSSNAAVDARGQIRQLGYSDAFVIAYCDGERITLGEARRREANGTCIARGENELLTEVTLKTAENLGLPTTNEVREVPELSYNQAPGAAPADPIELKQGLFFTVQIGVYNRPVGKARLKGLPDVLTVRLPNGQIRYSSGVFDSYGDAVVRREDARGKGIGDAYVVAYYKGERISVGRARRLLSEKGPSILQSNIEKETPLETYEVPKDVVRTDTVTTQVVEIPVEETSEKPKQRVQVVTKRQFEEFPRDVLNRYNTEGNFYYDAQDKRVKSLIYEDEDYLPRLYKFKRDIDTVYISQEEFEALKEFETILVRIEGESVPGDLMDWLLRLNYRKEFSLTRDGTELRIYQVEPNSKEMVQRNIRAFGLEPVIEKEIEEDE